jgi:hypothetical protein
MTTHTNVFSADIDESQLPADLRAVIAAIRERQAEDPRMFMSRLNSCDEGGWKMTTQLEKEKRGLLHVIRDGGSVKVSTASFCAHLIWLASQPPRKVRQPPSRYVQGTAA